MKGRIVITADGMVAFFVDEGSLEDGKQAIEKAVKKLQADGITFAEIGQVEQHRHAADAVHDHVHSGGE